MKVECQGEKIKEAVLKAERITGKNLALPILGSILCIASGKTLKFRATNLSLGIEIEVPAKIEKEGVVALKGSVLAGFFTTFTKNETVTFSLVGENLTITTKTNKVILNAQSHEDFPTIPFVEGEEVTLPLKVFTEGIKSVYFSASVSDIKPEIASVYIYSEHEQLIFVSTDSFRLAEKRSKVRGLSDGISLLVPYKNIIEILRVLPEEGDEIVLKISKNQIALVSSGIYITSRVIDGVFPDYKQIIPKEFTTTITSLKMEILQALKVSNIFSDKFNQISLTAKPKEKYFALYAKNTDVGETTAQVSASLTGESVEMNLNFKYLFDCFQSIPKESVEFLISGASRPMIIRGVGDQTFTYLIMPMNK